MRALATLLFVLAATAGVAVAGALLRAATLWLGDAEIVPAAMLLSLVDFTVPLVFATGILLALGYAARFAAERRSALATNGAADGPADGAALALAQPRDERLGLWMLRAGGLIAGLALAAALARALAASPGGSTAFSGLAFALRPLLAGAVLAAVGAALRRPRP